MRAEGENRKRVPSSVSRASFVATGVLFVVALLLIFGVLPTESLRGWRVPLIVVLVAVAIVAALPSDGRLSVEKAKTAWAEPQTLAALSAMVVAVLGLVLNINGLIGPSAATEKKQDELQSTLEHSSAQERGQLSEINNRVKDIQSNTSGNGDPTDDDPRARIVELTGAWSVQGFVDAVSERDTDIVDKYLQSGMEVSTEHQGASAILYGFQGDMNNDPVALLQTFQANGYDLDEELTDGVILDSLTDGWAPLMFDTELTPENYTGGYAGGEFAGSLLFWIVSRAVYAGPTEQDHDVLEYLIEQGADCKVARSFLDDNREILDGTTPFDDLYPLIESCAR